MENLAIQDRWGFALPPDYLRFMQRGLLQNGVAGTLTNSLLRWLTPEEIAAVDWPAHKVDGFIPFAIEPSTASLCWNRNHGPGWVFYSPSDSAYAEGFASDFTGATFRVFIEDLRGTAVGRNLDLSTDDLIAGLRTSVARCDGLWKPEWISLAQSLLLRTPSVSNAGLASFAKHREIVDIVKETLAFPMLGQRIRQYAE